MKRRGDRITYIPYWTDREVSAAALDDISGLAVLIALGLLLHYC